MVGPIVILVLFLLAAPTSRQKIVTWAGWAGDLIVQWAPFSFIVIALAFAAPVVSYLLMATWPKTPEPDNPLKRYNGGDDIVPD